MDYSKSVYISIFLFHRCAFENVNEMKPLPLDAAVLYQRLSLSLRLCHIMHLLLPIMGNDHSLRNVSINSTNI